MSSKKELGALGEITVDIIGGAVEAGVKVLTGSDAAEILTGAVSRVASRKLIEKINNSDPEELLTIAVVGTSIVIAAPALLLSSLFEVTPKEEPGFHDVWHDPSTILF